MTDEVILVSYTSKVVTSKFKLNLVHKKSMNIIVHTCMRRAHKNKKTDTSYKIIQTVFN